jgi:DNA polymerase V
MNRRFNAVIAEHSDIVEIYSIDESFYRLPVLPNGLGDVAAAHRLREAIARTTGLPTRIGLGPTRALSKVANALAKATEKVWGGVVDLHDKELRARLFAEWPVHEVWGVAKALSVRLHPLGVRTAADLAALPPAVARDVGTVVLERLVRELNGIECDDFKPEPEASKATAVTRQFGAPVTDLAELREAMVRRAVRAAEKIRHQALMATRLIVFAHGSRYRPNPPSASRQTRLSPPSNDPRIIAGLAGKMMEAMYQPGVSIRSAACCWRSWCRKARGKAIFSPSPILARPPCLRRWMASMIAMGAARSSSLRKALAREDLIPSAAIRARRGRRTSIRYR